ncbi:Cu2+-exporting ATPase [Tranquillimonas rosea]|uniref:Cu2+-exporting ATPase n=1 Tax=Tranquillimonas rosea TaxID=641238 RepID=A0A1H9Q047_9RHOB|nr:heavy metal translocating P-type ATPase [Tranquillimonas rosea]SER53770.1 Cu2+-exporting ATPase [Tranquillimonas rosea]
MTMACAACAALPDDAARAAAPAAADLVLHLPDIHCAACIASVEETLGHLPGVRDARVNLSLKRAMVATDGSVGTDTLVDALAARGHRAQPLDTGVLSGRSGPGRDLLVRIGVAGFAMMNVMLLSVAVWSGAADHTAQLFHLISAAIALPAVAFAGRPFFASALGALSGGRLNMDVPISLAIVLSAAVSLAGALNGVERAGWFDAALALTFFLLVGRYLDHAGRQAARSAAADLAAMEVPQAVRVENGREHVVRAATLVAGDVVRIRAGDRVPADGLVTEGESELDRAILTGESAPVAAAPGTEVGAGEINLSGPLLVRVVRAGADTGLRRLADLVAAAETQRSAFSGIADRAARIYAPLVHILGAAALVAWWVGTGDGWRALDVAISVLVITCPCALGLAVPAVSTVTTARLFRLGLLVKSRTALERLAAVDTVVFDKTGTLTTGRAVLRETPDAPTLALAAGLAQGSSHPLSRALVAATETRGIAPAIVTDLRERAGHGVEGRFEGRSVRLGRPGWVETGAQDGGVLLDTGTARHRFTFDEELRPDAADCVAALQEAGYGVELLSGDAEPAVARMAGRLGIETFSARVTPETKAEHLQRLAEAGHLTLMVGDGLNDTGALAVAHASLAPSSALDAARNAADVVLLADRMAPVAQMLRHARRARARMRQNIWLAVGYNAISVPVALAGLATPLIAALAMSTSSLTVTLNAMRGRA